MIIHAPIAFDPSFYCKQYGDLADASEQRALDHYLTYGILEGRQGSPLGTRPAFIEHIQSEGGAVLEIGPFCTPTVRGDNVRYLDVLDARRLRERAVQIGADPSGCPSEIHFTDGIACIEETFDAVVSSHAIEHQVDLINHLQGVSRVLRNGGKYYLFVPDKRYCFDHFLHESTIAHALQVHRERPTFHSLRSVVEHIALTTHNDPQRHWEGDHGDYCPSSQNEKITAAIGRHDNSVGEYIDVHAWYFTPFNFASILTSLYSLNFIDLRISAIYPTCRNTFEFFAVLDRD